MIPLKDHPSNLDKTARLVWEDRMARKSIYSVTGGFVAVFGGMAHPNLFASQDAAIEALADSALNDTRNPNNWLPMLETIERDSAKPLRTNV